MRLRQPRVPDTAVATRRCSFGSEARCKLVSRQKITHDFSALGRVNWNNAPRGWLAPAHSRPP